MFCNYCGAENPDDTLFCISCGDVVKRRQPVSREAQTPTADTPSETKATQEPKARDVHSSPENSEQGATSKRAPEVDGCADYSRMEPDQETVEGVQQRMGVTTYHDPSMPGKIGGWLLVFCLGLTVVVPLDAIVQISDNPTRFTVIFGLGLATYSVYTGIVLLLIRPNALKLVKLYFIVELVIGCLVILLSLLGSAAEPQDESTFLAGLTMGVLSVLAAIIWWLYFKKSRRVRATFGSNL